MYKLLVTSLVAVFITISAFANQVFCVKELQPFYNTLQQLPETQKLIAKVTQEGPISIKINTHLPIKFGAFWGSYDRTIFVNLPPGYTKGEIMGSILFELHNALVDKEMVRLDQLAMQGKIDKATYVREVEYLEYCNSKKASHIATQGIQKGIYPKEAHLNTYPNFDEHFRVQQWAGHSAWIAKNYDDLVSFSRS